MKPTTEPPRPSTIGHRLLERPRSSLLVAFVAWKLLLFAIVLVTPAPAYDTSTAVLLQAHARGSSLESLPQSFLDRLADRFTRWDAIYFTKVAQRGYANEQEWAFSWGFTQLLGGVARGLKYIWPSLAGDQGAPVPEIVAGLFISNLSHAAATVVLYNLSTILTGNDSETPKVGLLTSLLHIISPAGVFLSAPYSESLYSALAFTGYYAYTLGYRSQHKQGGRNCLLTLASAVFFSAACLVRSNGILNGIPFLIDFVLELLNWAKSPSMRRLLRLITFGVSGLIIGAGLVLPQLVAWRQFCYTSSISLPVWCMRTVPSIYTWVQDHYWNVGFLRYWTLSNLPLFLLAAPTIALLIASGSWALCTARNAQLQIPERNHLLPRLAIPQLVLAVAAITNYHVQVITRLGSGYVLWYLWISRALVAGESQKLRLGPISVKPTWVIRWMVMYALIQAVLYAGFLPPA